MSQPDPSARMTESTDTLPRGDGPGGDDGRNLAGKTLGDFRIERKLGQGGMGEVYLATQLSLNRPVALKVLKPNLLANPVYLGRFEAEAWSAAKLNHPNIVHIYSLGSIDEVRFIAMEYVPGTNLREYIERKGSPELPLALQIMRQSGLAVGAAGEVGLIHRDIKPENLLLTKKGQIKVADFGLCRDKEGTDLHLTQPGITMGTPTYMSPEQVQGRALDHRSDLYSLGVTFYHMLAGRPPFRAETALALAMKHLNDTPVSLAVHRPDLPPELVGLVMKLMARKAQDRYASAGEMLRDLARIRATLPTSALSAATGEVATLSTIEAAAEESTEAEAEAEARPPRRPIRLALPAIRVKAIALAAGASLAAGALGGWLARADDLLGPAAPQPAGPPGQWMADWGKVPRQAGPEAQYHHAQLQAPAADQVAAWLAVPGYSPGEADARWGEQAYTQLARALFRDRDAERLGILAAELERSGGHQQRKIAAAAQAGASALRGEVDEVLDALDSGGPSLASEPGLAELCLEVALFTRESPAGQPRATALSKLMRSYMQALKIDLDPADLARPR